MAINLNQYKLNKDQLEEYRLEKEPVQESAQEDKPSLAYRAGRAITPLGETLGRTLGIGYAQKLQKPLEENQKTLFDNVVRKIKDPNVSKERKQFYIDELNEINPDLVSQIPELQGTLDKSTKQILGEAAVTGLSMTAGGRLAGVSKLPLAGRVGYGTAVGGAYGASGGLAADESGKELVKSTAIGATIGGLLTLAGEGVGALRRGLKKTPSKQVFRGVEGTPKDIQKSMYYGSENIGDKMAKEGYRGTLNKINSKAISNKVSYGNELNNALSKYGDRTITKGQIYRDMAEFISDPLTEATPSQQKGMRAILEKMKSSMTPQEANLLKRKFAKYVSGANWNKAVNDGAYNFRLDFYKTLSTSLRKAVDKAVPELSAINDKWATAQFTHEATSKAMSKAFADTWRGNMFTELIGGAFRRTFGGAWFRTVMTGGKGTQISNSIMEALSSLSPVEKNMMIRYLTKEEKKE